MPEKPSVFSPSLLAALRNVLSAGGGALIILGFGALTPDLIWKIMNFIEALGVVLAALATLIGVLAPTFSSIFASFKATPTQQMKSVAASVAADPSSETTREVKIAMINATAELQK